MAITKPLKSLIKLSPTPPDTVKCTRQNLSKQTRQLTLHFLKCILLILLSGQILRDSCSFGNRKFKATGG